MQKNGKDHFTNHIHVFRISDIVRFISFYTYNSIVLVTTINDRSNCRTAAVCPLFCLLENTVTINVDVNYLTGIFLYGPAMQNATALNFVVLIPPALKPVKDSFHFFGTNGIPFLSQFRRNFYFTSIWLGVLNRLGLSFYIVLQCTFSIIRFILIRHWNILYIVKYWLFIDFE